MGSREAQHLRVSRRIPDDQHTSCLLLTLIRPLGKEVRGQASRARPPTPRSHPPHATLDNSLNVLFLGRLAAHLWSGVSRVPDPQGRARMYVLPPWLRMVPGTQSVMLGFLLVSWVEKDSGAQEEWGAPCFVIPVIRLAHCFLLW